MLAKVNIQYAGREGQGVGIDSDGNLYFVPGAVPGDHALVEFDSDAKRYRDAVLVEVTRPSSDRMLSVCPYFQQCGGCDWLNWNYPAQIRAKEQALGHVLDRAGLVPMIRHPIMEAQNPLGYRRRIQLRREGDAVGFFKRGSNDVVPIERCAVAHPRLNEELAKLKAESSSSAWRKVELSLESDSSVSRSYDAPHGALGFTQVNAEQNAVLQNVVGERVRAAGASHVLELYCGDANLTAVYLPLVDKVLGVDLSAAAMEKAVLDEMKFNSLVAPVDRFLVDRLPPETRGNYDTLILDPPRSGIGKVLRTFIHPRLKTVIYISCSSITFSQDVKELSGQGFVFQHLIPIDMFPQTRHLELVGTFVRSC